MTSLRHAARALIIAPGPQVLLVRFRFGPLVFWAPPGGGLEGDEVHADALRRELAEEVGLHAPPIGEVVYTHERAYIGRLGGQRDVVHRVDVERPFVPRPVLSPEQLRAEHITDCRWVSLPELWRMPTMPFDLPALVAGLADPTEPTSAPGRRLDDLAVPPVLVAVTDPPLGEAVATARRLRLSHGGGAGDELLAGRSVVSVHTDAAMVDALRARHRFQVVQLGEHLETYGPALSLPATLEAALGVVDQVLGPTCRP